MKLPFNANETTWGLKNIFRLRNLIFVIALITGISIYNLITNIYAPDKNVLLNAFATEKTYYFFSGHKNGFYYAIADFLEIKSQKKVLDFGIVNESSSGGFDNAVQVLSTPNSFGLVQEATLQKDDDLRNQIQYIAPLFMERMHILYDYDDYKKKTGSDQPPVLSELGDESLQKYFSMSVVNAGPIGSGSQVIANYILTYLKLQGQLVLNETHHDASRWMLEDTPTQRMDIMFVMTGAPLPDVNELLHATGKDIRLMSIDPATILSLSKEYSAALRVTDFRGKYDQKTGGVTTVGSLAYLIASKDVSPAATLSLLKTLENNKEELKLKISLYNGISSDYNFQLDEMEFVSAFERQYKNMTWERIMSWLVFAISVISSTVIGMWVLSWFFSNLKSTMYLSKYTQVYQSFFPRSKGLDKESKFLPVPLLGDSQIMVLSKIVEGIQELFDLLKQVREEYKNGRLTEHHYKFLVDKLKEGLDDFRNALSKRLYKSIVTKEITSMELIQEYYADGFLKKEDLLDLSKTIEAV